MGEIITNPNAVDTLTTQVSDLLSHKITYSTASFNCTTSMTVNSCTCSYHNFTLFKIFVISIRATSTCGRTRHTVTLPSGYSFGTLLMYQTISNDNNAFTGYTKEFNCPLWVSGSTLYLDIHKGSGLASTYDPPALSIYILSK